jgi:hypothetical protein
VDFEAVVEVFVDAFGAPEGADDGALAEGAAASCFEAQPTRTISAAQEATGRKHWRKVMGRLEREDMGFLNT